MGSTSDRSAAIGAEGDRDLRASAIGLDTERVCGSDALPIVFRIDVARWKATGWKMLA
jgi:hypothetical protein